MTPKRVIKRDDRQTLIVERNIKNNEVFINGKKTKWTNVREYPGYFHVKYEFEGTDRTTETFYATMIVLEKKKNVQTYEFKDELPTAETIWANQIARGVLV